MPNSPDDVYDGYYDLQLCPETLIEFEFPSKHYTLWHFRNFRFRYETIYFVTTDPLSKY